MRCLANLDARTARVEVLSQRLGLEEALQRELCHTVIRWQQNSAAGGGPYCLERLPTSDREELEALSVITECPSWSSKMKKLEEVVATFDRNSSAKQHLLNLCYKCRKKNWKKCSCKSGQGFRPCRATSSSSSSGGSISDSREKAAAMKSQVVAASAKSCVMKSRSGTRWIPVTDATRKRRVGRDPEKSRSGRKTGKSESGAARLKNLVAQGMKPNGCAWKKFKNGRNAARKVQKINERHYKKRAQAKQKRGKLLRKRQRSVRVLSLSHSASSPGSF